MWCNYMEHVARQHALAHVFGREISLSLNCARVFLHFRTCSQVNHIHFVRHVEIELEVSPGPRPIRETPKEETEALTGHGNLIIRPGSTEL